MGPRWGQKGTISFMHNCSHMCKRHRTQSVTEAMLSSKFKWYTLNNDIKTFVRACKHWISTTGGGKILRSIGPSMHGTKLNDSIQFDYIELRLARRCSRYVLIIRDAHSGYGCVFSSPNTSAENAAIVIIDWSASFVPKGLMSYRPTHFKNENIRLITKVLRFPHRFTLPYCTWSNSCKERLGRAFYESTGHYYPRIKWGKMTAQVYYSL